MDTMLERLVRHFEYDFDATAQSFQLYLKFLKTLHARELNQIDISMFNSDVCRTRYAALDYKKWNGIPAPTKPTKEAPSQQKVEQKKTLSSPSPTPINTPAAKNAQNRSFESSPKRKTHSITTTVIRQEIDSPVRNTPSNFSIFDSDRVKIHEIYDQVRSSLPSTEEELDVPEDEIFKFNIPEETEFEKKLYSEVDFWKMHEHSPPRREPIEYDFDDDTDILDNKPFVSTHFSPRRFVPKTQQILEAVQPRSPSHRSSSPRLDTIQDKLHNLDLENSVLKLEHNANAGLISPASKQPSPPIDKRAQNRMMRMRVIEYNSDDDK
jgi:hypothetical protein